MQTKHIEANYPLLEWMPYLHTSFDTQETNIHLYTTVHNNGNQYYDFVYGDQIYNLRKQAITSLLSNYDLSQKKVVVFGYDPSIEEVISHANAYFFVESSSDYIELYANHLNADIVINTSTMSSITDVPVDLSLFMYCPLVIDLTVGPLQTMFIYRAKELEMPTMSHIDYMRAYITCLSQYLQIETFDIDKIVNLYILNTINIVLIGMPSAGKTTIGQALASRFDKTFIDMDHVIESKTQTTIPSIFTNSGEKGFRKIEQMVANEMAQRQNTIIGTGGGTIKHKINMDVLKLNGIVLFIDRDLEYLITSDPNRPLSKNQEAVKTIYHERYPLYTKYADIQVKNNGNLEDTIQTMEQAIRKEFSL